MSAVVRKVEEEDIVRVREFATVSGVLTGRIHGDFYMMESDGGQLMTVAAIEPWDSGGLLRALVIDPKQCEMTDVIHFFDVLLSEAEKNGIKELFLITPSSALFESLGFEKLTDEVVPERLKQMANKNAEASVMRCSLKIAKEI